MNKEQAEKILHKYSIGEATPAEQELVEKWMLHGAGQENDLTDEELLEDLLSMRQRLGLNYSVKRKSTLWQRVAIAATIIIISAAGLLVYQHAPFTESDREGSTKIVQDRPAGKNVATLTLSDGTNIQLDQKLGNIKGEAGIYITNDEKGHVVYDLSAPKATKEKTVAFNTITTPRSGQYKVILPDGSKVWLNAASSIRFPVAFSKKIRQVELTGEGYFEVAKSAVKFEVITGQTAVEVLGTHFNVHAYDDQQAITLLEGSVKVRHGQDQKIIAPGEQAVLFAGRDIFLKSNVDIETITAWKDGLFQFNNTELKEIMQELERWYDVDVDINTLPQRKFNGSIPRNVKLSEVLSMIELTSNLKFKIEGRSVVMVK